MLVLAAESSSNTAQSSCEAFGVVLCRQRSRDGLCCERSFLYSCLKVRIECSKKIKSRLIFSSYIMRYNYGWEELSKSPRSLLELLIPKLCCFGPSPVPPLVVMKVS